MFKKCGFFGAQRTQRGPRESIEKYGVSFLCANDRLLPIFVHRAFFRRHHARTHLNSLGAECKGCSHRFTIGDSTCCNDGDLYMLTHQRKQNHRGNIFWVLKPASFAAFHHQTVNSSILSLESCSQCRHNVEDLQASSFQLFGVFRGVTRRSCHHTYSLFHHEVGY